MKRFLFISPHVDDIELGCGGTIFHYSDTVEIFCALFSFSEKSLQPGTNKDETRKENKKSLNILNVKTENIMKFNYETRKFPESRQFILDDLIEIKSNIKPDLVFVPNSMDIHQDHQVINIESKRAFIKNTSILGYENIYNSTNSNFNFFISLSDQDIGKKIEALDTYKSQKWRKNFSLENVTHLSKIRGSQIETAYAEAFEVIKYIPQGIICII